MGKKLDLNYFYGQESDQFNFIRIPKPLLFDPMYKDLTLEEAMTYSMLLDRMSLSIKNNWFDELGRAYVYCSIETVMEFANRGRNKAGEILKHLDEIGLIEKVLIPGRGLKIYVKNFIPKDAAKFKNQTLGETEKQATELENEQDNQLIDVENGSDDVLAGIEECADGQKYYDAADYNPDEGVYSINDPVYKSNTAVCESNDTEPQNKSGVVYISNTNNNNINNNILSNTKSNQTISVTGAEKLMGYDEDEVTYAQIIRDNISLDILMERYPFDQEFLQGVYDLILETVICKSEHIIVASSQYTTNFVRGKLLKLESQHIEYVLDCWKKNGEKPRNIKKYLLAALFNAPSTIDAYYQAEVNHDRVKNA